MVLSDILLNPVNFDIVRDILGPEDFYSDAHKRIYEAIDALAQSGKAIDAELVAGWLRDKGYLQVVGGVVYLTQIVDATPAVGNVTDHAKRVKDKARVRLLIATQKALVADAYGDYGEASELLQRAERAISDIAHDSFEQHLELVGTVVHSHVDALKRAKEEGRSMAGISTGFKNLDAKTAGLFDGDLYVVAGRPGMGKSALASSIAANVARPRLGDPNCGAVIFSLEMPKQQIAVRFACAEKMIDSGDVRRGTLRDDQFTKLREAAEALSRFPLWVDDTPAITLFDIRARLRKLLKDIEAERTEVECKRLGIVVVDYLQLMKGERQRGDSREQEVSGLSRGLKLIAKEFGVPVMALSQLSRAVEQRGKKASDKRPQLSDLRESGAIEQDADAVWFLFREGYYDDQADASETDVDIAKQRQGGVGRAQLYFDGKHTRFADMIDETEFDEYDDYDDG